MEYWAFPICICISMLILLSYGIYCDNKVKMRELDLIEKGIIKKEIFSGK